MPESPDPHINVTPWSKTPSRAYEPVDVEMHAFLEDRMVFMLLSKKNGFSMAINLAEAGVEYFYQNLADIRKRFKAHKETHE